MIRIYREGCYIQYFNTIENGYNIENTLTEILNGNKHRLSPNDKHCLNSLKNGHEIIVPDDLVNEIIEIKPIPKVEKEKKSKSKKVKDDTNPTKKTKCVKNDNSVHIINKTGEDIPIEDMYGIYSITNIVNGKVLISHSKKMLSRINSNINKLNKGKFSPANFQSDWNTYGINNFQYELLSKVNDDDQTYINYLKLKYMCDSTNSYHDINNKMRFECDLLSKIYENGFKCKRNYMQIVSYTERLFFDIAVIGENDKLEGFVIIDNSVDPTMTQDMLIDYQNLIQAKVKYCEDNNIGYKVKKVKME